MAGDGVQQFHLGGDASELEAHRAAHRLGLDALHDRAHAPRERARLLGTPIGRGLEDRARVREHVQAGVLRGHGAVSTEGLERGGKRSGGARLSPAPPLTA